MLTKLVISYSLLFWMQYKEQYFKDNHITVKPLVRRTKSQGLNVSCILAQLSSLNPLKPGVKLRMKM